MTITKQREKILRKQFQILKKHLKRQDVINKKIVKNKCKDLLSVYKYRWDVTDKDLIDELSPGAPPAFKDFVHDLRNGL